MPAPTAASLDAYLRSKRSPLAGHGGAFIQAGRRYGFDPRLLVAISGAESSLGIHAQGHNPFGWGPGIHFGSWGEAIDRVGRGLKELYLSRGLTTVEQIQAKWAPQHVANDPSGLNSNWARNVHQFLRELGGAVTAASGSPVSSPEGPQAGKLPSGPDLAGFASSQLQEMGGGRRFNAVENLTSLAQMIRSTPPVEAPQAAQMTGLRFEIQGKATELDKRAVGLAERYLGDPYVWGGSKPGAFDCSGLLQYVWGKMGVTIPRTTYEQINAGRAVAKNALRPGDAIFFGSRSNPHHVGMYIGGGKFIEAPHTGAVVRISTLAGRKDYLAARRYA